MRTVTTSLIIAMMMPATAAASEPMEPINAGGSATKARDINGFVLGEQISDAAKRVTVTFAQGELVQSTLNGITYEFGVCPSGRIYRIQSSQDLGAFIPDDTFMRGLAVQMFAKYGKTGAPGSGNWGWDLTEDVRFSDGQIRPFRTNWLSVMVSKGYSGPVTLDMKMIDFRICWQEKVKANKQPSSDGLGKVVF